MGEERLAKGCYFKSRWNRVRKNIHVGRSMHRCRYTHISRWSRGLIVWERKGGQRSRYFFFCILGEILPWSKTNSIVSKEKQEQKKKKHEKMSGDIVLIQKCLLAGQKVSHQPSVGLELASHRQLSSACRHSQAITWDSKEKSYLQACEKAGGGTCCPYTPVKQSGS